MWLIWVFSFIGLLCLVVITTFTAFFLHEGAEDHRAQAAYYSAERYKLVRDRECYKAALERAKAALVPGGESRQDIWHMVREALEKGDGGP